MHLVSYNIQYGKGRDGEVNLNRIITEIADADIIALQEVERFWPRSGNADQVRLIAAALPGHYWCYGAGVDLHCAGASPADNRRRQFGNMLLSRYPLLWTRHHLLPKYGSVTAPSVQRSALECTLQIGALHLRIYSLHLTHLSSATRLPQVQKLLGIHANAAAEGAPVAGDLRAFDWGEGVQHDADLTQLTDLATPAGALQQVPADAILLGDFNFQPDSAEYDLLAGPPCDYGGRIVNPRGFVDAWIAAGGDADGGHTSDVQGKPARLDYAFVSAALRDRIAECRVATDAVGSDHFPLWVDLRL